MSITKKSINQHHFLILLPAGLGDAVIIGASIVDQIIKNDPDACGHIDIVCNNFQAEIFKHDPRIQSIIGVSSSIFPTPDSRTWLRGIFLADEALALLQTINSKRYEAVFPGNTTPFFYKRIRSPIIKIYSLQTLKVFLSLGRHTTPPYSKIVRQIINAHFNNRLPAPTIDEEIPLYVGSQNIQEAMTLVRSIKERSDISTIADQLLVVAADTGSVITRPPTHLLAAGITDVLTRKPRLAICILPSYTDRNAAPDLYTALAARFGLRVHMLPPEPRLSLPEVTAVIDQADVFVTGDTGVMHLANANKRVCDTDSDYYTPGNATRVVALFGGTNPDLFGYSRRSLVLGKGRKEQSRLIPGLLKEAYIDKNFGDKKFGKKQDWFDHISPQLLTAAIVSQLELASINTVPSRN